jgi:hypothetical protein
MDTDLEKIWTDFNDACFSCSLKAVLDIDWHELSGEHGIGAHGKYLPRINAIAIDQLVKFDANAVRAGDASAKRKYEIASGLVLHEMVHQSLYEKNAPHPGQHGQSFIAEAWRISELLGLTAPNEQSASRWPLAV